MSFNLLLINPSDEMLHCCTARSLGLANAQEKLQLQESKETALPLVLYLEERQWQLFLRHY